MHSELSILTTDSILNDLHQKVINSDKKIESTIPVEPNKYFEYLVESITSQQLSIKAADTIFARFSDLINNDFTPKKILKVDIEDSRKVGLSYSKANYILNLAESWDSGKINHDNFLSMTDEDIINELIQVKGIGVWTAEMFLMFALARPNIFSVGDLGLRKAVIKAYDLPEKASRSEILEISENWSPHKTFASRILWRSLDI